MIDFEKPEEAKAYEDMKMSMNGAPGISWAALVRQEDGSLKAVTMRNRPCYGEMRRYADGTRPQDPHPGDLPRPIPKGPREAFAVRLFAMKGPAEDHNTFIEWVFGPDSPWRRGLGNDVLLHKNKRGIYNIASFSDTDVDPTVLANLLVTLRSTSYNSQPIPFSECHAAGLTIKQTFFSKVFAAIPTGYCTGAYNTSYYLSPALDFRRFFEGDTLDLSNGRTWRDQEDYNRPELANIFGFSSGLSVHGLLQRPQSALPLDYTVQDTLKKIKKLGEDHDF